MKSERRRRRHFVRSAVMGFIDVTQILDIAQNLWLKIFFRDRLLLTLFVRGSVQYVLFPIDPSKNTGKTSVWNVAVVWEEEMCRKYNYDSEQMLTYSHWNFRLYRWVVSVYKSSSYLMVLFLCFKSDVKACLFNIKMNISRERKVKNGASSEVKRTCWVECMYYFWFTVT